MTQFVTGFPGFLATRLVREIVARQPETHVVAVVEPRFAARAREVAAALPGGAGARVDVVEGDITKRDLGLTEDVRARLAAEMTHAYHLAAVYDLATPLPVAQRVNVDGTGNVLELCERAERFERLNHVSTAYVAGWRTGIVYEHELNLGQGHKNHYESTKFQSEVWVREAAARVPTAIFRPAIVVGDSKTGETQKFDGPYFVLRLIALLEERGLPVTQVGRSAAPFNVVPVDFVIDALLAGAADPHATGRTFHLVDPEPVSGAELTRILLREWNGSAPRGRTPAKLVQTALRVPAIRRLLDDIPAESVAYLDHPVIFDTRNTADLLARAGLRCPRFEEYAPAMVRYFREHAHDGAAA